MRREEAARFRSLKVLFLTLGTNRYYRLNDNGRVVANCHKQPGARFTEEQLDVEGAKEVLGEALEALWQVNPSLQIVFTVSPYRYAKYGFHGSRLGKAVLLLAVDGICRAHEGRCFYFPAYEIVLDELRDYRFYAADMLHPSEVAVEYILGTFLGSLFPGGNTKLHGGMGGRGQGFVPPSAASGIGGLSGLPASNYVKDGTTY